MQDRSKKLTRLEELGWQKWAVWLRLSVTEFLTMTRDGAQG